MKAVVLHEYGPASNLSYEDLEDPKPAAGEVLVQVSATSLNPADWMLRSGVIKNLIPIEFRLSSPIFSAVTWLVSFAR